MIEQCSLSFLTLVFFCASLMPLVGQTQAPPGQLDYQIYNGVLALMKFPIATPRIAISNTTLNSGCGEKSGNPVLMNNCGIFIEGSDPNEAAANAKLSMPQLLPTTWLDFINRNGSSAKLNDSFKVSWPHTLRDIHVSPSDDWKSPDGWMFFSRVGLDKDQKQALVYVLFFSYMKGVPTSGNFFLFQVSKSGSWEPAGRMTYMQTQ